MNAVEKMRKVMTAIAAAGPSVSFASIIEDERDAFLGMHVTYSTYAHDSYIQQLKLQEIEQRCPLVTSLFDGSGLLFYSDRIYSDMRNGPAPILMDYSIALDKNICEILRCYVKNVGFSRPDDVYKLLQLMRGEEKPNFNYDFFSYLVEEYEHMSVPNNVRPFETLYALKLLDRLEISDFSSFPKLAIKDEAKDQAMLEAQQTMSWFFANDLLSEFRAGHRAVYAMLLKALLMKWSGASQETALAELAAFSLEVLGKFAKREIYFAWKMLGGDGQDYRFFAPAATPSRKSISNLMGMSWDLTMLRWAEMMSALQRAHADGVPDFFLPFVASADQRFRDMIAACPLKAIVLDRQNKIVNSVFRDEMDFQLRLQEQIGRAGLSFGTLKDQGRRHNASLRIGPIEDAIAGLEKHASKFVEKAA
jgi:hypothetical protein